MQYTESLNLQKPGYGDNCDVEVLNGNFDVIDTEIKRLNIEVAKKPDEQVLPFRVLDGEFQYKVDEEWRSIVTSSIKSIQRVVALSSSAVDENNISTTVIPIASVNVDKTVVHINGGYGLYRGSNDGWQAAPRLGSITENSLEIKNSSTSSSGGYYFSVQVVEYY